MVDVASNSLPYLQGGKIKAYAVTLLRASLRRCQIPTVDEAGTAGISTCRPGMGCSAKGDAEGRARQAQRRTVSALADGAVVRPARPISGWEIPPRDQQTHRRLRRFSAPRSRKWWPINQGRQYQPE